MPAALTDKFSRTYNSANPNVARVTGVRSAGGTSLSCDNLAGWPTDTKVHFSTYKIDTANKVIAGSQIDWYGIVTSNTIGSLTRITGATDTGSAVGDVVEMNPTASWADELVQGVLVAHNQDGSLKTNAVTTATITDSAVTTAKINNGAVTNAKLDTDLGAGWIASSSTVSSVTANGNRSYTVVTGTDLSSVVSPGMRLRTTRTVAAPTQSTSLNGTNQYYSKTSPAGMTFTDDFVVSAWIKLSSYAAGAIASRYNGTSGWEFFLDSSGRITLLGKNGGAANFSQVQSYQSVPLNKWVHVAAQLDMSTYTATTTTSYIMIDGVDVPSVVSRAGTNPTALIQAGDLQIGADNATIPFPGKLAQVAIFNAKVTQATIRGYISQGLAGNETSLISAYSFDNSINDLNTSNANNLTANGSAVATNADSPFGGQANGTISSTKDYAIVQAISGTSITVQVAEGNTIPTSGGVSAIAYSIQKSPYGFPIQSDKWQLIWLVNSRIQTTTTVGTYVNQGGLVFPMPVGAWKLGGCTNVTTTSTTSAGYLDITTLFSLSNSSNVSLSPRKMIASWGPQTTTTEVNFQGALSGPEVTYGSLTNIYLLQQSNRAGGTPTVYIDYLAFEADNAYV